MEGEERHFASPKEEAKYWKGLAKQYKDSYEETKEELDEFQISSRELEAELEAQLEQQEGKNKELTAAQQRLQMEVESLREKLEQQQSVFHRQLTEMGDELAQVRAIKEELAKYIRELEQTNDDLERAKRATVVSLEDFEGRLNMAIERNAFLESELEERETLAITVQRLKDEARDLRQELCVKKKVDTESDTDSVHSPREKEAKLGSDGEKGDNLPPQTDHIDSNKLVEEFISSNHTPGKSNIMSNNNQNGGTPLTPSARISALNIVGDLLRKVGALESKLASCRNVVNNQPRNAKSGATSPLNSPSREYPDYGISRGAYRAKRLHRSAASSGSSATAPSSANSSAGAAPANSQQNFGVKVTL